MSQLHGFLLKLENLQSVCLLLFLHLGVHWIFKTRKADKLLHSLHIAKAFQNQAVTVAKLWKRDFLKVLVKFWFYLQGDSGLNDVLVVLNSHSRVHLSM